MKIAAMVDGGGNAIPFGEPGTVVLFSREGDLWFVIDSFEYELAKHYGLGISRSPHRRSQRVSKIAGSCSCAT